MDDKKLEILLATIRTGSFSKAAAELQCTQSAITQAMNSLENELGCRILERSHSGAALTAAGEKLFPLAIEAESALTRFIEQARHISEGRDLPIRIGSFSSISNTWLPQALLSYQNDNSHIAFDIRIGTDAITDWLLRGDIDVALGDAERLRAFRWYPLMDDPYYAVMPSFFDTGSKKSITQEEFARFPFIMAPMNALDRHLQALPQRAINVTCDDDSTLLSFVAQGIGVTAMPKLSLQHVTSDIKVLELYPPTKRVIGAALPNSPSKAAKDFVDHLRSIYIY